MKKYQCIACGTVKESKESCTCPVCGYMMFPQPYERSEVMIREIRSLADKTIGQEIDVSTLDFGKLRNDIDRFPDFQKIKVYVTKSEKTETFYRRLKNSAEQMQRYFHETFCKNYSSKCKELETLSEETAVYLQRVLLELGIEAEPEKAAFPVVTVQYTECANHDLIGIADQLLEKIDQMADKIYQFIRANNIYGRAYDAEVKTFHVPEKKQEINWKDMMAERISACDKVLEKKYIIDIFEDGSTELTAMVKVLWDAVFVL